MMMIEIQLPHLDELFGYLFLSRPPLVFSILGSPQTLPAGNCIYEIRKHSCSVRSILHARGYVATGSTKVVCIDREMLLARNNLVTHDLVMIDDP